MVLTFLWPICNGLLEACERVEASAQQVLRPAGTHHSTKQKPALLAVHQAVTQDVPKALSSKQGEPISQVLTETAPSPVFWSIA
jgi:hypothetical protein